MKLETERMILEEIGMEDFHDIHKILSDIEIMYAWEKTFTEEETREWIEKNLMRYERDGYSYLIAREKRSGRCIGLMGPLKEEVEGKTYDGIAYIVDKRYWGRGYVLEGGMAAMEYLFQVKGADEVVAVIKEDNLNSQRVAERLGMTYRYTCSRRYGERDMPHMVFSLKR